MQSSFAALRLQLDTLLVLIILLLLSPMLHAQSSTGTLLG